MACLPYTPIGLSNKVANNSKYTVYRVRVPNKLASECMCVF